MSDYFVYNGTDSRDFGIVIFEGDTFGAPQHEYDTYSIPGRNGALYLDGRRFPNKAHRYECVIYDNFEQNLDDFRNFILSQKGYKRLEDTLHPDEFYEAVYANDFLLVMDRERSMGKFSLEFDRKPQRFLKIGENTIDLTSNGNIANTTLFDAQPLIRVYGTGTLGIGDNAIKVNECDVYVDIDCALMEAYKGAVSYNDSIEIQNIDFPVLEPGTNEITLTGITRATFTPRWKTS